MKPLIALLARVLTGPGGRRRPVIWFLLPLLGAALACSTLFPPRPAVVWDPSPTALVLRATNCCGLVPRTFVDNYLPEAQLWGDGRLIWVEHLGGGARRVLTSTLTPAQMQALLEDFVDAGFFGWDTSYADYGVTDMPSTCLALHLAAASHQVCEYYQGAPKAFHRLYAEVASGYGQPGQDYLPERAYLNAYPLASGTAQTIWPAEALGFSLAEAAGGRWVEGPALELAWSILNSNQWNTLVREGGTVYELTIGVPGVSYVEPPP